MLQAIYVPIQFFDFPLQGKTILYRIQYLPQSFIIDIVPFRSHNQLLIQLVPRVKLLVANMSLLRKCGVFDRMNSLPDDRFPLTEFLRPDAQVLFNL